MLFGLEGGDGPVCEEDEAPGCTDEDEGFSEDGEEAVQGAARCSGGGLEDFVDAAVGALAVVAVSEELAVAGFLSVEVGGFGEGGGFFEPFVGTVSLSVYAFERNVGVIVLRLHAKDCFRSVDICGGFDEV